MANSDSSTAKAKRMPAGSGLTAIPCILMRGGTSKGPFFNCDDLPADPELRNRILLRVMGSPHVRQIDGVGGADPVTSKVAIIGKSSRPDADVDYHFAQVIIDRAYVDTSPSCGNMLTAVAPYAVDTGLVRATDPETVVRIWDANTESLVEARVQTPGGVLTYEGDLHIDGVNDTYAPIALDFKRMAGAKSGALFPTGKRSETILGVEVSCVDMAMPVMFVSAAQVGKTGYESKAELDGDAALLARLEEIRLIAGERMGFGDVRGRVIPKVAIVAPPAQGGTIASRYFVPYAVATAYAVTGGVCLSTACCIEGTVPARFARLDGGPVHVVGIEHPQGKMFVTAEVDASGQAVRVIQASLIRHARKLMAGEIYVPSSVWAGPKADRVPAAAAE